MMMISTFEGAIRGEMTVGRPEKRLARLFRHCLSFIARIPMLSDILKRAIMLNNYWNC
jgi:hypothetical protein